MEQSSLDKQFTKACITEAALSNAVKRKVGALVIHNGKIIGKGHNYAEDSGPCEVDGKTRDEVIHAEVAAIENAKQNKKSLKGCDLYVTHQPCAGCEAAITAADIANTFVVGNFLKFDTGKIRYDLIPPEASKALAEVLTYGAKKYMPNNWKKCEDTDRYLAALIRHLEAHRMGELRDEASGMFHMAHVLTNTAFIIYFLTNSENENGKD